MVRGLAWLALLAGCQSPPPSPQTLEATIVAKLKEHPEGAQLLRAAPSHRLRMGTEAGISPDGTVRLQSDQPAVASAARYGHLLHHMVHGSPFDDDARGDCEARIETARTREKTALALEDRLRASFGLDPLPSSALQARVDAYRRRCR